MFDPDRPAEQLGSSRPSGHRKGQWVAVASLVVAILTLLIALPGALNDWTALRTPRSAPTDTATSSTASVTPTKAPTSPSNRPSSPPPSTPKPDQNKSIPSFSPTGILRWINTFRANLGAWSLVSVAAAGAVIIFVCAGICRFVIITSYWPIGIPTWAVLIGIPLFVWPSISGYGTSALTVLGIAYAVAAVIVAWIAAVVADE